MSKNLDPRTIMEALQMPFSAADIEWRVARSVKTSKGDRAVVMAYVTNRAIQKRLDELFSPFGWRNEFREWREKGVTCGISILWNGEWITKYDGSDESNFESTKGGFSGSQKRAAVQWGIGRYLYDLDEYWVDVKPQGQNYINDSKTGIKGYWDTPKLPEWALPESERKPTRTKPESQPRNQHSAAEKPKTADQASKPKPAKPEPSTEPRWIRGIITDVKGTDLEGSPCYAARLNCGVTVLMPFSHPFCDRLDEAVNQQMPLRILARTWDGREAVAGTTGKEIQPDGEVA